MCASLRADLNTSRQHAPDWGGNPRVELVTARSERPARVCGARNTRNTRNVREEGVLKDLCNFCAVYCLHEERPLFSELNHRSDSDVVKCVCVCVCVCVCLQAYA